ncbi:MAG: hypothetical protein CVU09_15285 [Bacteroidetes bacterium HGW-Bacteroidetes-4]|nr:MAG: hypothetical protein CVU09_15285 [Bacteroidetes bacterium HGW-Bacteroidetes-4]
MKKTKLVILILFILLSTNINAQGFDSSKGLLWFSSNDTLVEKDVANRVSGWLNAWDASIKATQSTPSLYPLFVDSIEIINNESALYFETDKLDIGNIFNLDSLNYLTLLLKSYQTGAYSFFVSKGYSGDGYFTVGRNNTTKHIYYWIDGLSKASAIELDTNWVILTIGLDRVSKKINLYKNSVLVESIATAYDFKGSNSFSWAIGSNALTAGFPFKGFFTDIIFLNNTATYLDRELTEKYLKNKYAPPINLPQNINIAYGFADTTINAFKPWFTSYLWSNGSTDPTITVNQSGTYIVEVTDIFGFTSKDSITVSYPELNYPISGSDTTLCLGDTLLWNTGLSTGYSYDWFPVQISSTTYPIYAPGQYAVKVSDSLGNYLLSDTLSIADGVTEAPSLSPPLVKTPPIGYGQAIQTDALAPIPWY